MRWTVYAGWLNIAVGLAIGVGAVAMGYPAFGALMLIALGGAGAFMVWLANGWDDPLEGMAELHRYGRPANATVMKVEDERLRPEGVRLAKLTLRVAPVNEPDFRTRRVLVLPKGRVPAVGERVTVKFDPQQRGNVVLLEETFEVKDRVTAAREQMRAFT